MVVGPLKRWAPGHCPNAIWGQSAIWHVGGVNMHPPPRFFDQRQFPTPLLFKRQHSEKISQCLNFEKFSVGGGMSRTPLDKGQFHTPVSLNMQH